MIPKTKPNIKNLSISEISAFLEKQGEKSFRAKQIYEWLWKKGVTHFDQMNNLTKALREMLDLHFNLHTANITNQQESKDGTIKYAFTLHDNEMVEGVIIPAEDRSTACISTQVGCSLRCTFCATGTIRNKRDLTFGEIYDQVLFLNKESEKRFGFPLTNVVVMGMGEPLLNYDNVLKALDMLISPDGMAMSPRRITLSTAGIADKIKRLADDNVKFNLAISLHTANNAKRMSIMPVNKSNPLPDLAEALRYFHKITGTRITYEYLLLGGFNDSVNDAKELAAFCRITPCKINLIEYNPVETLNYQKSSPEAVQNFADFLEGRNMVVNIRKSRGQDIDAACGQLANKLLGNFDKV